MTLFVRSYPKEGDLNAIQEARWFEKVEDSLVEITSAAPGGGVTLPIPNNSYLTARNFGNSADLDMIKINTSDQIQLGIGFVIPNQQWFAGRNAGNNADVNIAKVNSSNEIEFGTALLAIPQFKMIGGAGQNYGIDFAGSSYAVASFRMKNAGKMVGLNAAGNADIDMIRMNSSDRMELMATMEITDAKNVVLGTTTGTKWGTNATQKQAWFGSTPIVQPSNTTDLRLALINLGLIAGGGSTPLNTNGGFITVGSVQLPNDTGKIRGRNSADAIYVDMLKLNSGDRMEMMVDIQMADGVDVSVATGTGTMWGTSPGQKMGWWGATPVARGAAWTVTNLTTDRTLNCNLTSIDELADLVGTLITEFQTMGQLS